MRSSRVIFIDLARAVAVIAMVYGHTIDAVLSPVYRTGTWFTVWQFQRGLTSCLFLLLSGFAFSIATARHWARHIRFSPELARRTRRFALFIALGYSLHLPVQRLAGLWSATAPQWQSFLRVDVLQLIGATFLLVQALVLVTRKRRIFGPAALLVAAAIVLATPAVWDADWSGVFPPAVAAYLSPTAGSQFPLFPWAAYVLVGIALGEVYARWDAASLPWFATWALLLPGAALVAAGIMVGEMPAGVLGPSSFNWVPPQVALRTGSCLVALGVMAHGSAWLVALPHAFAAVAQETLLVYFVHLCIVYGSIWSGGLAQTVGRSLTPAATAGIVIALLGSMTALAAYWNWQKHTHPARARAISAGAWAVLLLMLT